MADRTQTGNTCTHCNDPITHTQPGAVDEPSGDAYHRECYCKTFQPDCPHCNEPIELDDTTRLTRNGYYHNDCYTDAHADAQCTTCNTALTDGQNLREITNKNGDTEPYCTDCYDDLNAENARDMRENINDFRTELNDLYGTR